MLHINGQCCQLLKGVCTVVQLYCQHLHAMIFPYLFFMRFSSFLAESHGADCPSKKLCLKKKGRGRNDTLREKMCSNRNITEKLTQKFKLLGDRPLEFRNYHNIKY